MKKWVYFVLAFLFFLSNTSIVRGESCRNIHEYTIVREWTAVSRNDLTGTTRGYASSNYADRGEYNLKEGDSICGIEEYENGYGWTRYRPVIKTCGSDGNIKTQNKSDTCDDDSICYSSVDSSGVRVAVCKNVGKCEYVDGMNTTYYSQLDNPKSVTDKINSFEEGETVCFGNVIKKCVSQTGDWMEIGTVCSSGQYCKMKDTSNLFGAIFLKSTCESTCKDPYGLAEQVRCKITDDKSKLIKCHASDSKWYDISFSDYFSTECHSCSEIINAQTGDVSPACNDGTQYCDKLISNGTEETGLNKGTDEGDVINDGTTICNKSGNQLYVCNKDNSEDYKNGYYSFYADCSAVNGSDGKPMVCGVGDDGGKARCLSQTEASRNDQSVVRSEINISVSSDTGFMCTTDRGEDGVRTAFGCVPITASGLASALLPILFGIAGGISFLRMIYGFILMATSSGDEKKFIEAKSIVSSAIIGLLVSIFAIFLFRLIFVNILQIPGLS